MTRFTPLAILLLTATAHADTVVGEDEMLYSCKSRTGEVTVTLKPETEVHELMTWVMGFTCKNFVLDPRVVVTSKKVTIIAPAKLTATEAYRVFLTALATVNLTVVPKGKILRIVDAPTARHDTVPIYKSGTPEATDQIVRYVYRPTYAAAETMQQTFLALKSDAGDVQTVGTLLLITDYGGHVRDMMSLAKLVDVPKGSDGLYTIPVKHADASKLADKLGTLLGTKETPATGKEGKLAAPAPSKILVDERTNTLVVAASEAGYQRAKALVDRLDIELDVEGGATFHVYKLGSAIAEELAKTLNDAISGVQKPGAATPKAPGLDQLGQSLEGQVKVIADKPSNALIVTSTGRDFLAIKEIIRELDLPRRQVYLEALILEINVSNGSSVGTSSHGVMDIGGTSILLGGAQTGSLNSTNVESVASLTGLIGGMFGAPVSSTLLGTSFPSYGLLFQALASSGRTNILSAPSLIALDNETAKYKVGTNIAYKKGQSVNVFGSAPSSETTNIDRRDLAIQLEIKPHISIDDTVLLEIKHDAEDLVDAGAALGPTWSTRSFETRVVVKDQASVVIGGLIQEREDTASTKVPFLGDIPLLGHLFKYTTKTKRKTNLVILLTPYIIKDQLDLQQIRERKLREHVELSRSLESLDHMKYEPAMDYRRKRGLVEEINLSMIAVDEDIATRAALERPSAVAPGPIEVPSE